MNRLLKPAPVFRACLSGDPERDRVEGYIATRFREVHGANIHDFMPVLVTMGCHGFPTAAAGIRAAAVGGGYEEIRGTSFATPIVAGLLARSLNSPEPAAAQAAVDALAATAIDLGNNGVDPSYGKGLVGAGLNPGHRD